MPQDPDSSSVLVRPLQPFNFLRTLKFILSPPAGLNGLIFEPLMDHFENGEYRRAVKIDGRSFLYGVSEERNSSHSALRVRVLNGLPGGKVPHRVRQAVAQQFATDLDLAPFHRMARNDNVLGKLVKHFRGMRIPQAPSVYECVVCAILEQQVNLTFAHQVKKALVETYGDTLQFEGRNYHTFPEPITLGSVTPADFRKLQISGPKARYIIGISRAVAEGSVNLEGLRYVASDEARALLLEHKGIGPWTAEYVCLRALGKLDHLPSADVGLQKAIQIFYRLGKAPAADRVERIGKKWAGWRSYATFYLWLTYWEQPDWKTSLLAEIYPKQRSRIR
jgi:DNA-3-methyladenine glycosylase II